ncbi:MAG: coiled-coil [Microgenomates group bacterium GW2011_GWC1_37_8]|uniref:Endopeptidase lytE n=1 Tax=Candidatus Woesebacteria bacterium GW2011_GWB1_38_8 TaxID=1618570 RepID=A0A0G0L5G7_9BACT|nr:MAG: coiled-coil [Microgenomates group bacterium GW2011_GWC1_37_8]KKQ86277.1 MAG: Endopeptidase lytE [Candidatus Woesebacteria bacterium GW2011_GWB1_38_8]
MNKLAKILLTGLLVLFFTTSTNIKAETETERLERLNNEIQQYEQEIQKLKSQASTLSNQIAQYDAQVRLTTLKVEQTQEKITLLGGRINQLEFSLQALANAFASRVVHSYKMTRLYQPLLMLLTSNDITTTFESYHYLQKIQKSDRDLLVRLEDAQVTYTHEKENQEVLKKELEEQKKVLGTQKAAKATLLEQTRNDEKKYQQLLSAARAEFEAIQAIIAGKGQEEEVGKVSQGQRIASIIQGPSCNSSGGHLHFIVSQSGNTQNPFSQLKNIDFENCSGSSCGSSDGDPFNPSGSWDWPINPKVKFTQGYGSTWAVRNTWVGRVYSFHNGIDIDSGSSPEIRAVRAGTLYQGSYSGSSGCRLRYVRIDHDDSDLETFYLHINY